MSIKHKTKPRTCVELPLQRQRGERNCEPKETATFKSLFLFCFPMHYRRVSWNINHHCRTQMTPRRNYRCIKYYYYFKVQNKIHSDADNKVGERQTDRQTDRRTYIDREKQRKSNTANEVNQT